MQVPTPDDRIQSRKQFVHFSDELLDSETVQVAEIVMGLTKKYQYKTASKANLEALRDEALNRCAEINILVELDPAPILNGEPPVLEIKGKLAVDDIHKHGFDHEQKKWEIDKAHDRGEDYLGEKESLKSRKKSKE